MKTRLLETLTRKLQRQRAILFGEVTDAEADLQFITEDRETDLEERAQEERAARLLAQLDVRSKREIEEIDAALRRIAEGVYGTCEGCGQTIPEARLRALPATRFCVRCVSAQEKQEQQPAASEEAEKVPHTGSVPADLRLLSDRELAVVVREQVKADGRMDTQELRIVCRQGVVHLDGALPSEAEHHILRQLVTDVLGLEDVVDHLQIKEVLWERVERTTSRPATKPLLGGSPYGTEDIVESLEEGTEYVPPMRPTPEEE